MPTNAKGGSVTFALAVLCVEPGQGCIVPAADEVGRVRGCMQKEQGQAGSILFAKPVQHAGPPMLQSKGAQQLCANLEVLLADSAAHPDQHVQTVCLDGPPARQDTCHAMLLHLNARRL